MNGLRARRAMPPAALSLVFNGPSCARAYATGIAGSPGERLRTVLAAAGHHLA